MNDCETWASQLSALQALTESLIALRDAADAYSSAASAYAMAAASAAATAQQNLDDNLSACSVLEMQLTNSNCPGYGS